MSEKPDIPAGTNALPRKVEVSKTKKVYDPRFFAEYTSADGEEYVFRTHDKNGKPFVWRENLAIFLAIRELSIGGDGENIFKAFNVKIEDATGKKVI